MQSQLQYCTLWTQVFSSKLAYAEHIEGAWVCAFYHNCLFNMFLSNYHVSYCIKDFFILLWYTNVGSILKQFIELLTSSRQS
jgi:hypothetical protein